MSSSGPRRPSPPWQPRAHPAVTRPDSAASTWLLESGASHHMTADLENLSLHHPYPGADSVQIGDRSALPITHTGETRLSTSAKPISLRNILLVPQLSRNLISVFQLCTQNNISVRFCPQSFQVTDLCTGTLLLTGKPRAGVYELPSPPSPSPSTPPIIAFSGVRTCTLDWHARLGHPAPPVLRCILASSSLPVSDRCSSLPHCRACPQPRRTVSPSKSPPSPSPPPGHSNSSSLTCGSPPFSPPPASAFTLYL